VEYQKESNPAGSLKISKNVIATIAKTTALEIDGVASFAEMELASSHLLGRNFGKRAIRISLNDDFAVIDLHLNLEAHARIPDVCAAVQSAVKDNVQTMTGIAVSKVNVVVAGVVFPADTAAHAQ